MRNISQNFLLNKILANPKGSKSEKCNLIKRIRIERKKQHISTRLYCENI